MAQGMLQLRGVRLTSLGVDGIWFGILFIQLVEIAQITPPVGISVYVTQAILADIISLPGLFKAIFPFFIMDVITVAILIAFPQMIYKIVRAFVF